MRLFIAILLALTPLQAKAAYTQLLWGADSTTPTATPVCIMSSIGACQVQIGTANLSTGAWSLAAAALPAFTGGDCTTSAGSVVLTCTKTNGVSFAPSATVDTTNPANILKTWSSVTHPATRNLSDVLETSESILRFVGIDPTGVADSTAGIQWAADWANATGNVKITFPCGTYKFVPPITWNTSNGVRVEGMEDCSKLSISTVNPGAPAFIELADGAQTNTTSATTQTLTYGNQTFTVSTGLTVLTGAGVIVRATATPYANYGVGAVVSYNSGTGALVVSMRSFEGSGAISSWTVAIGSAGVCPNFSCGSFSKLTFTQPSGTPVAGNAAIASFFDIDPAINDNRVIGYYRGMTFNVSYAAHLSNNKFINVMAEAVKFGMDGSGNGIVIEKNSFRGCGFTTSTACLWIGYQANGLSIIGNDFEYMYGGILSNGATAVNIRGNYLETVTASSGYLLKITGSAAFVAASGFNAGWSVSNNWFGACNGCGTTTQSYVTDIDWRGNSYGGWGVYWDNSGTSSGAYNVTLSPTDALGDGGASVVQAPAFPTPVGTSVVQAYTQLYAKSLTASTGWAQITPGDATHTGYYAWIDQTGTRTAFMGYDSAAQLTLNLNAIPFVVSGSETVTGTLKSATFSSEWPWASSTPPTITSGFCTSPSVPSHNGTVAFEIQIGSACAAGTGVLAMPSLHSGWVCNGYDVTNPGTVVVTLQAETASSVTLNAYSRTTGGPVNYPSGDVLHVSCVAY